MDKRIKIFNFNKAALEYATKDIQNNLATYQKGDVEVLAQRIKEALADLKTAYQDLFINADDTSESVNKMSEIAGIYNGKCDVTNVLLRNLANHGESLNVFPPQTPSSGHRPPS